MEKRKTGRPQAGAASIKNIDEAILALSAVGKTDPWIGEVFGVSKAWIWRRRMALAGKGSQKSINTAQKSDVVKDSPMPVQEGNQAQTTSECCGTEKTQANLPGVVGIKEKEVSTSFG